MKQQSVITFVDLDRKAETTVRRAANLARLCQAPLLVVHVVDESEVEAGYSPFISPSQASRETARTTGAWLRGLLQHAGAGQAEIIVVEGRLQPEIIRLAEERHAAYVVTGQSRWGILGKLTGLEQRLQSVNPHCQLFAAGTAPTGIRMPTIDMPLRGGA
ncbi:universal stress protein [Thiohalobacter thiocyanaticus]|uniref:Universal stress protein n=1 Tax=Thiohalobacter thiocyanaticus TaxID=585455 RepID=A0A426QFP0_9GAMM|nr:universal stress protein [Thiohalobacter thiocyanaticus]RRQ20565.1 universal stress protein [Thiohalobacter thiocyanaticus]